MSGTTVQLNTRRKPMQAKSPEEINDLFIQYMREGDLESVLTLYDADVAFAARSGEVRCGVAALREELGQLAAAKQVFKFDVRKVIRAGDIALVHNRWETTTPSGPSGYALEVARRQPDGSWRWLIGDPFTVGRQFAGYGSRVDQGDVVEP
jgi:ketosteroid isomerase-like protein